MDAREEIRQASVRIADAIGRRDVEALRALMARGFAHRTPGERPVDADTFLAQIQRIPGEILFVRLDELEIDVCGDGALVTGIQHAQVRMDGQVIDDRRGFLDWFVLERDAEGRAPGAAWRIRAATDLPLEQAAT